MVFKKMIKCCSQSHHNVVLLEPLLVWSLSPRTAQRLETLRYVSHPMDNSSNSMTKCSRNVTKQCEHDVKLIFMSFPTVWLIISAPALLLKRYNNWFDMLVWTWSWRTCTFGSSQDMTAEYEKRTLPVKSLDTPTHSFG